MDLIYANENKEDLGVMCDHTLDLAFGEDENDMECKIPESGHCCKAGYFLYYEHTEYGGIIDKISVDTGKGEITYKGRTWHGILNSKVIEPDIGEDYLVVSGEGNEVLSNLIDRMGLAALFTASKEESGIMIHNYKMNRYIKGYDGIRKMLKEAGAKLHIIFINGFVELSARPLIDYSQDEQFDRDMIDFKIESNYNPINHVVCLGAGNLAEREVIHVYADENGNISDTKIFEGVHEYMDIYDYPSVESSEELRKGGVDIIRTSWNSHEVKFDFNSDDDSYDIGDIVGAKDRLTGIEAHADITKKIVKIEKYKTTISYKVGD